VATIDWVLLSYRLPSEPSRLRLAVWRRLKRLGAVLRHDALWLLPADAESREAFDWLAQEIDELGGTALVFEARGFGAAQDRTLVEQFRAEAGERYRALAESADEIGRLAARRRPVPAAGLQQARRQLAGLERAVRLERRRDHFRAPERAPAEAAIRAAAQALEQRLRATAPPDQKGA
jgi:hypothetical protein